MTDPKSETKITRNRKIWLIGAPVLAVCYLAFCGAATWMIFRQGEDTQLAPHVTAPETGSPNAEAAAEYPAELAPKSGRINAAATPAAVVESPTQQTISDQLPAPVVKMPAACRQANLSASSVVTGPVLSPISFSTHATSDGWPLDVGLQFPASIDKIQATFSFAGMENGAAWDRVWYFGDQEIFRGESVWDAGPRGQLSVFSKVAQAGFVPGRYRLEIQLNGEPVSQGEFYLVSDDAPTDRPVEVAFSTWDGNRHQLDLFNFETGEVAPLLEFARHPAWSPDTDGLLFVAEDGIDGGTPGLWVHNMTQQKSYQLNDYTDYRSVAWSPHRTFMATASGQGETPRLVLQSLEEKRRVIGPVGDDPAWSPEGRRLAYRSCSAKNWGIFTVEVIGPVIDGDSIRQITEGDDRQPAWSPDGQRVVFVRDAGESAEIFTVATAGGSPVQLTDDSWPDAVPVWLPDGRILYQSLRDGAWTLVAVDADGANPEILPATETLPDEIPDRPAVSPEYVLVKPTPAPPPKPRVQVPPGKGVLVVSNLKNNDEMTFTIDNFEHKIPPFTYRTLPLNPGHYTWTASWPGKNSRSGIADVALGQAAYPVVER